MKGCAGFGGSRSFRVRVMSVPCRCFPLACLCLGCVVVVFVRERHAFVTVLQYVPACVWRQLRASLLEQHLPANAFVRPRFRLPFVPEKNYGDGAGDGDGDGDGHSERVWLGITGIATVSTAKKGTVASQGYVCSHAPLSQCPIAAAAAAPPRRARAWRSRVAPAGKQAQAVTFLRLRGPATPSAGP